MANLDHTAGRSAFGGDAAGYQSARPPYPDWVFAHMAELCGGAPGETFEIGPGTGQATRRLLAMGARVTAVEPDARLAARLQALGAPDLRVRVETFEAAELPQAAFDLGLAATSFHWLEQAPALAKVGRLLRPGGVWAAIANVFGDSDLPDAFHDATQGLLGALPMGPGGSGRSRPYALDIDARLADLRAAGLFGEFVAERRNWTLVLDAAGVRALYGTYSNITTQPEVERERILDGLAEIAEGEFGGRVERNMVTSLYAAAGSDRASTPCGARPSRPSPAMDVNLFPEVVAAAKVAGADAAEAVFSERQSLSIGVRLGALEEVEREESRDLGLRVFVGKSSAAVSGSDISAEGRAKLVERVVAMARLAPEDPFAGLAPEDRLARERGLDLDLFDPVELEPEQLESLARTAEDSARAVQGVTNSEGGSATWSSGTWRLVTSHGFSGLHKASSFSLYAAAIASDENGMERGGDGRAARWRSDLPGPEGIGAEAGKRAVQRLGARKIASTTAAVIFENRGAGSLLGPLIGAISGPAIARGVSFLKDKLGTQVFAKGITLTDDPHRVRGLGSSPWDDEGVANERRAIIDDGVLTTWLLNCSSALQLGLETTGHASRGLAGPPGVGPSNMTVEPGERDLAGLMADAGQGVLVTSMFGPSLNGNTGDWSVGCSGFWFENGEIAYPVTEITVAGNLIDIYARLVPGSDLEFRGAHNTPSLLVDKLAIAGK